MGEWVGGWMVGGAYFAGEKAFSVFKKGLYFDWKIALSVFKKRYLKIELSTGFELRTIDHKLC